VQLEDLSSLRGFVGTLLVLLSGLAKEWCRMTTQITMTLVDTTTKGHFVIDGFPSLHAGAFRIAELSLLKGG